MSLAADVFLPLDAPIVQPVFLSHEAKAGCVSAAQNSAMSGALPVLVNRVIFLYTRVDASGREG
jgi:hypothetical protein